MQVAYFNGYPSKQRGRPRSSFTQMGEFDLSLIREFRNCTAFYDRSAPEFKDKVFTAHKWQEISNKLGFDVSLLKDRMLQLRNRYNLEKRRLEQLRDENPGRVIESPWPLFEKLHFLSDHIRARRSYKHMMPIMTATTPMALASVEMDGCCSSDEQYQHSAGAFPNGLLTVKVEEGIDEIPDDDDDDGRANSTELDSESQSEVDGENSNRNNDKHTFLAPYNHTSPTANSSYQQQKKNNINNSSASSSQSIEPKDDRNKVPLTSSSSTSPYYLRPSPAINIRNINKMCTNYPSRKRPLDSTIATATKVPNKNLRLDENIASSFSYGDSTSPRVHKYVAFGNFLSSSLMELPAQTSLALIEQFTSALVKVLLKKPILSRKSRSDSSVVAHGGDNGIDPVQIKSGTPTNGGNTNDKDVTFDTEPLSTNCI